VVLVCEAEKWTGVPCARVTPAEPVTVATADGGTFTAILCLRHRERLAREAAR
jgi:hypothetical protein